MTYPQILPQLEWVPLMHWPFEEKLGNECAQDCINQVLNQMVNPMVRSTPIQVKFGDTLDIWSFILSSPNFNSWAAL